MDPKLQRRVQRYGWDRAAGYYESYWQKQLRLAQTRLLEMAALRLGEKVLDVSCGTGMVTFPAVEAVGPSGTVLGTDISQAMIDTARQEATRRGLTQVTFERMDAEQLDIEDGSFDVVLNALGLMFVPEVDKALREMYRALRGGGRAVAAVWGERNRCGWAGVFPIVDARVESEVCPLFFQLGTRDTSQKRFESAGFVDVVQDRISTTLHYDSADAALGAVLQGGAMALAYSRFDDATRDEIHSEYLATIEPYRKGAGYDVPAEFVVTSGRKTG
jgi:ubiquinone/menaquinone biosynthesis C-methylase UbiE